MTVLKRNSFNPLYNQIKDELKKIIFQRKAGERFFSENEIAAKFSVSRMTARKALNDLAEAGLIDRKVGKGSFIAEKAKLDLNEFENNIAFCVYDFAYLKCGFCASLAAAVGDLTEASGVGLTFATTGPNKNSKNSYINLIEKKKIRGVIIYDDWIQDADILWISERVPVVLIDRVLNGKNISSVSTGVREGAALLTEHLLSLGHKRIALTVGFKNTFSGKEKIIGYTDALQKYNVEFDEKLISEYGNSPEEDIYRCLKMNVSLSAIIMFSDPHAIEGVNYLKSIGFKVPENISITGFKGDCQESRSSFVTTLAKPIEQVAESSCGLLMDKIFKREGHTHTQHFYPHLIEGITTGKVQRNLKISSENGNGSGLRDKIIRNASKSLQLTS